MSCILTTPTKDQKCKPTETKKIDNLVTDKTAPFHPVYLSSLLNQTVFIRDCDVHETQALIRSKASKNEAAKESQIRKDARKRYDELRNRVSGIMTTADEEGYLVSGLSQEETKTIWAIYELIDKSLKKWDEEKF
jgi:hypothetical protein